MGNRASANWSRVLIDVCTQRDFIDTGAILQVSNRDKLLDNLKRVFRWVESQRLAVVSIVESHRPTEVLNGFPLHCVDSTPGQAKLPFTLHEPWTMVEADNCFALPLDLCTNYHQLVFRKRSRDVLGNPKTDRFMTHLAASEIIICGVGLERSVKSLALGLLARHKTVTVIYDACGYWSTADAELSIRQLAAKGIKLVTTEDMVAQPVAPLRKAKARVRPVQNRHHPAKPRFASRPAVAAARQ